MVVVRGVLERAAHLLERAEIGRVQHVGTVDGYGRNARDFRIDDVLKAELVGRLSPGVIGVTHLSPQPRRTRV